MKLMLLSCLLSVAAAAQVSVTRSVKDDPASGLKFVTILLEVKGDKPYKDGPSAAPPELGILCQETSLGKKKKLEVSLTLGTGVVAKTGYEVPDATVLLDLGLIATLYRVDGEPARQMEWQTTPGYPGILSRNDFKFVHDRILKSKSIQIEVTGEGTGTKVSSFDLSALREEYARHPECKK